MENYSPAGEELEKTFLLIKPEAVERGVQDEIIQSLVDNGFRVLRRRDFRFDDVTVRRFYSVHEGKPFYEPLLKYMTSGPVVGLELEREGAVGALRKLVGATDPSEAAPGTIRHRYGTTLRHNAVHASDSPESAQKELAIVFPDD